jgi:hypothetical protein
LSADKETAEKARADLQQKQGDAGIFEQAGAQWQVKDQMLLSADYLKFIRDNPEATDTQKQAWAKENGRGKTLEQIGGLAGKMNLVVKATQKRDMAEMASRAKVEGQKQLGVLTSSGMFIRDEETNKMGLSRKALTSIAEADAKAVASGRKPTGGVTAQLLKLSMEEQQTLAGLGGSESTAYSDEAALNRLYGKGGLKEKMTGLTAGLSGKEEREMGMQKGMVGTRLGQDLISEGSFRERFDKGRRGRGGGTRAAADLLGLDISKEEAKAIGDITKGGDIDAFILKAGLTTDKDKDIRESLKAAAGGKGDMGKALAGARDAVAGHQKEAKEKQAAEAPENVLQRKMVDALEKMERHMSKVKGNTDGLKEAIEDNGSNPATDKLGSK